MAFYDFPLHELQTYQPTARSRGTSTNSGRRAWKRRGAIRWMPASWLQTSACAPSKPSM